MPLILIIQCFTEYLAINNIVSCRDFYLYYCQQNATESSFDKNVQQELCDEYHFKWAFWECHLFIWRTLLHAISLSVPYLHISFYSFYQQRRVTTIYVSTWVVKTQSFPGRLIWSGAQSTYVPDTALPLNWGKVSVIKSRMKLWNSYN